MPDIAFQFAPCLTDEYRRKVVSNLRRGFRDASTVEGRDPDVRSRCFGREDPAGGRETIGVWREPLPLPDYPGLPNRVPSGRAAARDRALVPISLLQEDETFAGRISYVVLHSLANKAWEKVPRRLSKSGRSDRHGPIRLRTFTSWFTERNEVMTHVTGDYEEASVSVGFDFTLTDALSVSRGELTVNSNRELDVDETPLAAITVALAVVFPPLAALGLHWMVLADNQEEAPPDPGTSMGAMLVQMLPRELMISGGQKIVFSYGRLLLSPGSSVSAGGTYRLAQRDPAVEIEGARSIWVGRADPPKRVTFRARLQDLRPPVTGSWTLDGQRDAPDARDTDPTTETIAFDVAPGAHDGAVSTRRIAVALTDADGLTGRAAVDVRVHVVDPTPLCQQRPHLPQCQPR